MQFSVLYFMGFVYLAPFLLGWAWWSFRYHHYLAGHYYGSATYAYKTNATPDVIVINVGPQLAHDAAWKSMRLFWVLAAVHYYLLLNAEAQSRFWYRLDRFFG